MRARKIVHVLAIVANVLVALLWGGYLVGLALTYGVTLQEMSDEGTLMVWSVPLAAILAVVALCLKR